ncbi:PREDICTED: zeatin O-glucosyltransferase-like [Nicotiana attenuata]|uniref:Glycosyltransferase n=1 Tax=Nicotiana attenuata TaxID=49451 RepID=A0A0A1WDH9_NICAT|nr:PREDICTED: zeatin O-glucosyltransferase-like [Nicotiana attenuata]AQQ16726.1 UDP-glycosyltransferase g41120 [Nicotiana attenuata]OIT19677.1 zeatin o-glucosyltransferase [Nicotiana attenuata]
MAKTSNLENHDQEKVVVVMVPLPAQGHLNQLLHFSRLISAYHLPLHYVGTTTHTRQAKIRVQGWDPHSISNIHFHEFSTPCYEIPPPNPHSSTKFPSQLMPSFHATCHLREPITSLLRELARCNKRVIVIYDSLIAWVLQDTPSIANVECYSFRSISALNIHSLALEFAGKSIELNLPSIEGCFTQEFLEFSRVQREFRELVNSGDLYNSCYEIEGLYLHLLAKEKSASHKQWAVGPLNPVILYDKKDSNKRHNCLEWLDKQEPNSVIFVSFGTTTSLSDKEIEELAIGLEQSQQKFIWVLRDADKGDMFTGDVRKVELPKGYEERVEGRGLIVRDWAPQLEILGHLSTGGFMSHCGWNSCMESISMGVPTIAWPMHSDQPRNAFLVTNVLKIGIMLRDWALRDELVTSVMVEECVKRLMDSVEGDKMRERAVELSKSVVDGGGNRKELDSFIAHITR